MKKKETIITFEQEVEPSFHQKLDRELNFNLKLKHSSRNPRYKRTPYDELREQGNLNAAYFKEQFAYISEKGSKLPSRTRRVIVYEITLAVHTIMEREKALEAKREKAKRTAIPAVIASPYAIESKCAAIAACAGIAPCAVIAGSDPQSPSNPIN